MKKTTLPPKSKRDFEKLNKNPLSWCPLFGYIPDISKSHLASRPIIIYEDKDDPHGGLSIYDLAFDIIENIKNAREYWGVSKDHFNMLKHNWMPNVKELPLSKYHSYENKRQAANWLFITIAEIVYYRNFHGHINQWTPFVSSRKWDNLNGNVMVKRTEGLLERAQEQIDDAGDALGFNYKLNPCELYALFAIHEAWLLLIELLTKHDNDYNVDEISDRGEYIDQLLLRASDEFDKMETEYNLLYLEVNSTPTYYLEYL